jgi:prepilin-type N-terminal cleavage/methylation domain-containing protein
VTQNLKLKISKMTSQKGFTLIEMLVVIAVVGILSAAVLASLGPARERGRDTRIISGLNQIAALAEIEFTGNSYPADLMTFAAVQVNDIKQVNNDQDLTYFIGAGTFAVSSPLASSGSYCVDSSGFRGSGAAVAGGECN